MYTEEEVRIAFREQGIGLREVVEFSDNDADPYVILGPLNVGGTCRDSDLRVNIFRTSQVVKEYLEDVLGDSGAERYDANGTIGFRRGNVLVGVRKGSSCFPPIRVGAAVEGLP